jgi:coenzyme F420-0:L-glutamate ligase/coenzyme F420-1:gamma-L-glutamate ligase
MSTLTDALKQRRSIRKYQNKAVPKETILKVLIAAGWAPSAHNSQPWRFIIVENPVIKRELAERMAKEWAIELIGDGYTVDQKMQTERMQRFANAPALVVACQTMDGLRKFPDEKRQKVERDLAIESLGAALQNMLLIASDSGLGACWYCAPAFCKSTVREVLKIPQEVDPAALILLGYPDEVPAVPPKKELKDYCFFDTWGQNLLSP